MSKLLAISFDAAASPQITLLYTRAERLDRPRPYGWGIAWYAGDDRGATVVKDPTAISDSASTRLLRDWSRFRSTTFLCHLRGAAARISQENTHPFVRSYSGRDWVMTHHGQLGPGFADRLALGDRPVYQPVGRTDTEHVLCWLLQRCRELELSRLADIGWERLHAWFAEINVLGTLDVLLTDGTDLVAYQDCSGHTPLHWVRQLPPFEATTLASNDIEVDFGDVRDRSRTAVLFATEPLLTAESSERQWAEMQPGQMLVVRRGALLFDSSVPGGKPAVVGPAQSQSADPTAFPAPPASGPVGPTDLPAPIYTATSMQQTDLPTTPPVPGARTYDVLHSSKYSYDNPVELSRHVLRLRPIHDRYQHVLSYDLSISPLAAQHENEDVFGNAATRFEMENPYSEMEIVARSRVTVLPAPEGELRSSNRRTTIPLSWMPWQRQMMLPYLLPMELPEPQLQELFDYAMSFAERQDGDVIETLLDINSSIYRDYAYVQGVTSVETTPFEVYTTRRGVCQDFANLLICLARLLNVPARYRVGYIHTGANYENKLQSDASHAWVEVFLPWLGWKGFDPTNGCLVSGDHIRVASGRHYRDATPTSGTIYRGGGEEKLAIEVRVIPVNDGNG